MLQQISINVRFAADSKIDIQASSVGWIHAEGEFLGYIHVMRAIKLSVKQSCWKQIICQNWLAQKKIFSLCSNQKWTLIWRCMQQNIDFAWKLPVAVLSNPTIKITARCRSKSKLARVKNSCNWSGSYSCVYVGNTNTNNKFKIKIETDAGQKQLCCKLQHQLECQLFNSNTAHMFLC